LEFREEVLTAFPDDTSKHLISRWGKGNGESGAREVENPGH
jgi:hypothetical protein